MISISYFCNRLYPWKLLLKDNTAWLAFRPEETCVNLGEEGKFKFFLAKANTKMSSKRSSSSITKGTRKTWKRDIIITLTYVILTCLCLIGKKIRHMFFRKAYFNFVFMYVQLQIILLQEYACCSVLLNWELRKYSL